MALNGLIFAIFLSFVLVIFGWSVGYQLLSLASKPSVYRDLGLRYYLSLLVLLPAFLITFTCNGILQAQENTVAM